MLTESIARDDVRAVAALRRLQSDSLKTNKRLLDDFEITLLDLLDDSGKIFMLDRLTAFIILMTRAIKTEHRFFCLHILRNSISEECKRKFVEQGGLRLLKVWIRIGQEEESLEQLELLIKICKELPFDHGEVRRADIGKSIKKLLKFQMKHANLQKFHADVNDLIGFWKSEIEKFKFTRDANEQDEIITTNTTNTTNTNTTTNNNASASTNITTHNKDSPPSSNSAISNQLEWVTTIQSSTPPTMPSNHIVAATTTAIISQTAIGTSTNSELELNTNTTTNNSNRERTNDFVSTTVGSSSFVEVVGKYSKSQNDSNDNNNNLPLDIDTLEEVYMNDNGEDLDSEFLSFEQSSSQYAYKEEDEVEEANHLLSQDNNDYDESHFPTSSLQSLESLVGGMEEEEDSIANKLSDSTEELLKNQETLLQVRQESLSDNDKNDSVGINSSRPVDAPYRHTPTLTPINTTDDYSTEISDNMQLMDWEKNILGITTTTAAPTTTTTATSSSKIGNNSSTNSMAFNGVLSPPSSTTTTSPRSLAWGQSIEGRLKAAASAAATSSPSGLLRNSPRQNRSHLRVRFAEDLVQVRTFEVDRIVTSVAAHKIGRASSKEMHRKDSHMDKRVQGNTSLSMNRPQFSASVHVAQLPVAIDEMSTVSTSLSSSSVDSSENANIASSFSTGDAALPALTLITSTTLDLGEKSGMVVHQPCATCGISDVSFLARCVVTDTWFCNGSNDSSTSHIITHFLQSGLNTLALPGQAALECGHCGTQNLFKLGIIPGRIESNYIISCESCAGMGIIASSGPAITSPRFDTNCWAVELWTSIVQGGVISSQIIGQYSHPTINPIENNEIQMMDNINVDVDVDDMDLSEDNAVAMENIVSGSNSSNSDNTSEVTTLPNKSAADIDIVLTVADTETNKSDLNSNEDTSETGIEQQTGSGDVFDMDSILELLGSVSQFFTMLSPSELSTIIRIFAEDVSLFSTVLDETGYSIDEIKLLELTQQLLEKDAAVKAEKNRLQISIADNSSSSNSSSSSAVPSNSGKVRKTSKFSNSISPPPVMENTLQKTMVESSHRKDSITDNRSKPLKRKHYEDTTTTSNGSSSGGVLTSSRSVPASLRGNAATSTTTTTLQKTPHSQLLQIKCKFFNTVMGCRYGNECRFGHFSSDPYINSMTGFNSVRKKGKAND